MLLNLLGILLFSILQQSWFRSTWSGGIKGIHLNLRGTKNPEKGLSLHTVASGPHDVHAARLGHDGEVKLVGAVISFNTLYHLTEVALIHYVKEKLKYYKASIALF